MIKRKQLFRHDPENGLIGDCHRTAIGCILGIEPQDVPHWGMIGHQAKLAGDEKYDWRADVEQYLNRFGYSQLDIPVQDVDNWFSCMDAYNPHALYLMGGTSPRGTDHTVICRGGEYYWDPHPDGGFFVGPMSNKLYEATFLVPLRFNHGGIAA